MQSVTVFNTLCPSLNFGIERSDLISVDISKPTFEEPGGMMVLCEYANLWFVLENHTQVNVDYKNNHESGLIYREHSIYIYRMLYIQRTFLMCHVIPVMSVANPEQKCCINVCTYFASKVLNKSDQATSTLISEMNMDPTM